MSLIYIKKAYFCLFNVYTNMYCVCLCSMVSFIIKSISEDLRKKFKCYQATLQQIQNQNRKSLKFWNKLKVTYFSHGQINIRKNIYCMKKGIKCILWLTEENVYSIVTTITVTNWLKSLHPFLYSFNSSVFFN